MAVKPTHVLCNIPFDIQRRNDVDSVLLVEVVSVDKGGYYLFTNKAGQETTVDFKVWAQSRIRIQKIGRLIKSGSREARRLLEKKKRVPKGAPASRTKKRSTDEAPGILKSRAAQEHAPGYGTDTRYRDGE